jgi:hypothetical protein
MNRTCCISIVLFITLFSHAAERSVFPLQKGNYWVYSGTAKWTVENSNIVRSAKLRWTMEVIDVSWHGDAEVAIVEGGPWDLAWYGPDTTKGKHLIIRVGQSYYLLHDPDAAEVFQKLDAAREGEVPAFLAEYLWFKVPLESAGKFCSPDQQDREDSRYCWVVDDVTKTNLQGIQGVANGPATRYGLAFRTNPDHEFDQIVPGVGIVFWEYQHHGTTAEASLKLIEFHNAADARSAGRKPVASNIHNK